MRITSLGAALVAVVGVVTLTVGLVVMVGSEDQTARAGAGIACALPGDPGGLGALDERQRANADMIVEVGTEMGVPQRGHVIAIATALQEATLYLYANDTVPESFTLPHDRVGSDEDSLGLFQQRAGWGSVRKRMDPATSARLFYEALLDLPDWESLPLTVAAQRVQISAFPDAYAKWEDEALQIVGALAGVECNTGSTADPVLAAAVVDRALSQLGTPYVWGGGNSDGPTRGIDPESGPLQGYDCSGLMVFAFSGIGVAVPHQTQAIWAQFAPPITDTRQLVAGDMLLFSDNGAATGIHHVGLYLGDGRMVHAPQTGTPVQIDEVWQSRYWSGEFIGAVRAVPAPAVTGAA